MQDLTINPQMTKAELLKAVYDYATRINFITQYTPHIESVLTPEKVAEHIGSIFRNRDPSTTYLVIFVGGSHLRTLTTDPEWLNYFDPCSRFEQIKTGNVGSVFAYTVATDVFFVPDERWSDDMDISFLIIERGSIADKFMTGWVLYGVDRPEPKPTLWQKVSNFIKRLRTYPA